MGNFKVDIRGLLEHAEQVSKVSMSRGINNRRSAEVAQGDWRHKMPISAAGHALRSDQSNRRRCMGCGTFTHSIWG
jgi:hypothetical protein